VRIAVDLGADLRRAMAGNASCNSESGGDGMNIVFIMGVASVVLFILGYLGLE
jgi:hypothetical protein